MQHLSHPAIRRAFPRVRPIVLPVALSLAGVAAAPALGQSYSYQELAKLPGYSSARAGGMNNLGAAVGSVYDPATYERLAVIWDAAVPSALPSSLGAPPYAGGTLDVAASDINDFGEIVGAGTGVAPPGTAGHGAFHWSAGTGFTFLAPIDTPSWHSWQQGATSINCAGNIVGGDVLFGTFSNGFIGLHWQPPTYAPVIHSPPGGIQTYGFVALSPASGNDLDEIVGTFVPSYYTPAWFPDQGHAFFWESSTGYTTLSVGAFAGDALDVNNCEQVIGHVRYSQFGEPYPVLWERGPGGSFSATLLPLISADPDDGGIAVALSDAGQAIGRARDASGAYRPVVWDFAAGTVTDLTAFLPAPDPTLYATIYQLSDINNQGLIVGTIFEQQLPVGPITTTAFVLTPAVAPVVQCPGAVCAPAALALDLLPPVATPSGASSHVVTFTVVNGTPGETVHLVDDTQGRYRQLIATQCPFTPPPAAMSLGSVVVDAAGTATFRQRFRNGMSGATVEYVVVEPSTCRLDAELFTHP